MRALCSSSLTRQFAFVLVLLCAWTEGIYAQAINTSSIYNNEFIGVRGAFGDWNIITNREQAPDELKPNFPANKGPNDSPLFIALHGSEQLFMRLLTETYFDDLEAYVQVLGQGITSQGLEITSARIATDNTAVELSYRHPQLGLRFLERVALLPDSQVIRMAAWTLSADWNQYAGEIAMAFRDIELRDVINGEPGWQPVWADLDMRLGSNNLSGVTLAQADQVSASALSCTDPGASMLWRVESPAFTSSGSELYLYGSIHVGKEEFYPLPDEIEEIFKASDYLVFEVDPNSAADPAVLIEMQTRGMLPPGQTLGNVLSEQVMTDLSRVVGSIGIPVESLMSMQPWLLTIMLTQLQMSALGYGAEYGLESYFLSQKPMTTEILELESIQQQIGFLENLNAESFLSYTLKSFESGSEEVEELIAAWQCADKEPLTEMLFSEFEAADISAQERAELDALMESMYTQRNIDMAEKIAGYAQSSPGAYFVVVGSAHLLGEDSVVALLRDEGFVVTPVRVNTGE